MVTDEDPHSIVRMCTSSGMVLSRSWLYPLVCALWAVCKGGLIPRQRNCFHCWRMNLSEQWASLGSCVQLIISKYGTVCCRDLCPWNWAGVVILIEPLVEFPVELRMLADKAYPSWAAEQHQAVVRNQFIKGVNSPSILFQLVRCLQHLTKLRIWLTVWSLWNWHKMQKPGL